MFALLALVTLALMAACIALGVLAGDTLRTWPRRVAARVTGRDGLAREDLHRVARCLDEPARGRARDRIDLAAAHTPGLIRPGTVNELTREKLDRINAGQVPDQRGTATGYAAGGMVTRQDPSR